MCCFFTSLVLLSPRLALIVWWMIRPIRFATAFDYLLQRYQNGR
jgi:hypothetical protein